MLIQVSTDQPRSFISAVYTYELIPLVDPSETKADTLKLMGHLGREHVGPRPSPVLSSCDAVLMIYCSLPLYPLYFPRLPTRQ